ncbi:MAG: helix-turn-helix domain-containing protein [Methylobacter sp.]
MIKVEQAKVVKTFGQRMKEARELCNFSQKEAASLFGYSNSSKLAKIEAASDTNSIPVWIIPKAAIVYTVSVDYLFGISDDWERDPVVSQERDITRWLFDHWERAKSAEVNAIRVLHNKVLILEKAVSRTISRSKENLDTINRVREINPQYDDKIKLGSKLARLLEETAEEAFGLSYDLKRYRAFVEVAKKEGVNLDIFEGDDE